MANPEGSSFLPDAIPSRVAATIESLCNELLDLREAPWDCSIGDLGGDSMTMVQFWAGVARGLNVQPPSHELRVETKLGSIRDLLVETLGATCRQGDSFRDRAMDDLAGPVQELRASFRASSQARAGRVPSLPNRHSYFLRRERNLAYWNVGTRVLAVRKPIQSAALRRAVDLVVQHHDGLRLQGEWGPAGWEETVVGGIEQSCLVERAFALSAQDPEFVKAAETEIAAIHCAFSFPGPLFRVLHLSAEANQKSFLLVVAHHLLVDGHSFEVVLEDLFSTYRLLEQGSEPQLANRTTSYFDFARGVHWFYGQREETDAAYWRRLQWSAVEPFPGISGDIPNIELNTRYVRRALKAGKPLEFTQEVSRGSGYQFNEILLAAIAAAYCKWTGQRILHLAAVFHGRESFLQPLDLSRTVGWVSETVPLLLPGTWPTADLLAEVRAQVRNASSRGISFGLLRFATQNGDLRREFSALPAAQVSMNVLPASSMQSSYSGLATPDDRFSLPPASIPDTTRVFALSGGVYFREDTLWLSWDFSDKILDSVAVEAFSDLCVDEISTVRKMLGGSQ